MKVLFTPPLQGECYIRQYRESEAFKPEMKEAAN